MSLPDEILKAKNLIFDYEESITKKLLPSEYTCVCCKDKKVTRMDVAGEPLAQQEVSWNDGTLVHVSFGWGSSLDMESYYVAICDNCMEQLYKEGHAISLRDVRENLNKVDENYELF